MNANTCRCGCNAELTGKSLYRPGHDARHAGQVGRALAAKEITEAQAADLLTPKLLAKALRMATKPVKSPKNIKPPKSAPTPKFDRIEGKVKIGRWYYPAVKQNGYVTYTNRQGEMVQADEKATNTFMID